ncbi:MAG: hypothetical protein ACRDJX_00585 [Solirubrobacteraceae bacterium]
MSQHPRIPAASVGERVELDRYSINGAERVIYGQRVNGVVRVTDRPAHRPGRSYLIERGLEQDGYSALKALVNDYRQQVERLQAIPMASSVVRDTIEQEAA